MKYYANLNMNQNELQNAVIQNLPSAPSNPKPGQLYFNTGSTPKKLYYWNESEWIEADGLGAIMTAQAIVNAINGSAYTIDDDNLSSSAQSAITNSHTHSNKTVLDNTQESFTTTLKNKLDGIEASADVTDAANVGSVIHGATNKATPVDADELALIDSANSNALAHVTWANVRATLKAYNDGLYNNYTHPTYTYVTPTADSGTTLSSIPFLSTLSQTNGVS